MQEIQTQYDQWEMFKNTFSADRLNIFLNQANSSPERARRLYVWNAKVSASLWEVVGYLEVGLRTVVDRQLSAISEDGEWLDNPNVIKPGDSLLNLIAQARVQATIHGRSPSRHHTLEQLPLGFLQALLSKKYLYLWPTLASGFLGATRNSHTELSQLVKELRRLRNRIGHHNHLLDLDLPAQYSNLMRIAEMIDPQFHSWVKSESGVLAIIEARPKN